MSEVIDQFQYCKRSCFKLVERAVRTVEVRGRTCLRRYMYRHCDVCWCVDTTLC